MADGAVLAYRQWRLERKMFWRNPTAAFFSFVFSLVPVLGSGLVWIPVGVTLLFTGHPIGGVFILGWGALVLGSVDNVVKPLYAKGALQLSPLLVFVSVP